MLASMPAGGFQQMAASTSFSAPSLSAVRTSASGRCRSRAGARKPKSRLLLSSAMQGGGAMLDPVAMGSAPATGCWSPAFRSAVGWSAGD